MSVKMRVNLLIALGILACLALALHWRGAFDPDGGPDGDRAEARPLAQLENELFEELRRGATLRGLPGMESRPRGHGILRGAVMLHVPGAGPRPLPGVTVRVLGHESGARSGSRVQEGRREQDQETDEAGAFTFERIPADVGYVILVDHAPYRRIVLRGVSIAADRETNVGTLLLGAPTALRGEVVDAAGRPVRGARVQVLRDQSRPGAFDARRALFELQSAASFLAEAQAQSDGSFVLDDLPPGRYVLRVAAAGYATTFKDDVLVTVAEHSSTVRVVLDLGSGFHGRVLDESARGIADARVIAIALPGKNLNRFDRVETRTAADGTYRLDTLISGMSYGVEAWAEGYAPTGQYLPTVAGMRARDFHLRRSGRIEGRVTDAVSGAGIPDAEVTVVAGPLLGVSPVSTMTDAGGGFVLPHVNPGPILVFAARASGYQPGDRADMGSVNGFRVVAGETTWIDWTLQRGGAVSGRVTSTGGRPVPYASLALVDRKRGRQRWTGEITGMTEANGRYTLFGVQPGVYDLHVNAAGYAPPSEEESTRVEMGASMEPVVKDVELARGATLYGSVSAPDGAPVRGARVRIEADGSRSQRDRVRDLAAVSGAAGRYRIQGVPPGMQVRVVADHDAYVEGRSAIQRLAAGQEARVPLQLGEGVRLPGRVEDARGAAIADARVRWGRVEGVRERDLRDAFSADEYLGSRVLRTDEDGRFEIPRLAPGRLLLKVEREGYAAWYRRDLEIGAENPQPAVRATLEATRTIRGRVTGADTGRALVGAFVYARERGPAEGRDEDPGRVQAVVSAETDAAGGYVLERVPPGTHEVVVWFAEGYVGAAQDWRDPQVKREDVPAGATGVDFVLDPVAAK